MGRPNWSWKAKEQFEAKAQVIRGKLSKAKAEVERLKSNGKITKKGKRNRAQLMKECGTLSIASLVRIIYGEREIKTEKIKTRVQGQGKTGRGKKAEQTVSFGCWSSLLEL